ncbi:MAG: aldehyde dehydrogenase family protein [Planctomycetes bacterium]|nr:aldehyde dehydrogenase family protein [Planctomycetota bacterium]
MHAFREQLGLADPAPGFLCGAESGGGGALLESRNPATGELLGRVRQATRADYETVVARAAAAFEKWRLVPAPQRGEIVRQIGDELRRAKEPLARLVTAECGKLLTEARGEVQEMIDIADFAVGLSRQLYGLTMHSERASHRMYEQWHPLGVVGIISAFNFPVAVWSWNAMLAAVCGNAMVWKPSPKTPLSAVAAQQIATRVLARNGHPDVMGLLIGEVADVGEPLLDDKRVPLVSATGSCAMGRVVGERVARRFGRTLLELGGNNAILVLDDADLGLALRAIAFGAAGTAGQRCTTTRRVYLQKGIAATLTAQLVKAYGSLKIGDPLAEGTLVGPLIDRAAVTGYERAITQAQSEGATLLCGGKALSGKGFESGCFVEPTLMQARADLPQLQHEVFAPITYLIEVADLDEAIRCNNGVPQGLSSALFTLNLRHAERFLSTAGSDCGIANINIGTSGAEIGGAFGGEKETGGGREAGSDSWKAYMRRQTCTINWGTQLPLAQGVVFDVGN